MKSKKIFLVIFIMILLVSCNKPTKWVDYTFNNIDRGVKFSIQYPKDWKLIENLGWDGDETRDASPDTGVQFHFSENEIFNISALSFSMLDFNEDDGIIENFITNEKIVGKKYINSNAEHTYIFYSFTSDILPQYFACINMSTKRYEQYKSDIEKVIKSFTIIK